MTKREIIQQLIDGAAKQGGYCERETPIGNIVLEIISTPEGERRMFKLNGKAIGTQKLIDLLVESGLGD